MNNVSPGGPNPSLVVFADDWARHPSSCQHLVRRLRDRWRILWVNTVGTRRLRPTRMTIRRGYEKIRGWSTGLRRVSDEMWVLDAPMLPIISSRIPRIVNRRLVTKRVRGALRHAEMPRPVVLTTLPYTVWLLGDIGQRGLIYNCTDDYSEWPSADRSALRAAEREMDARANHVLAVSRKLVELHGGARRCDYFPHAVDFEHFASARSPTTLVPPQLASLPGPRVGFFGLIYEKLDFNLLSAVARELSPASVVMIGPVDYCCDRFARLPNVHLVGRQSYGELPGWVAGLDVLLMPYVDDPMIRQSNPLKLLECLATGKPTISIDIPEVRKLEPHVRVAGGVADFVAAVKSALRAPESGDTAAARQAAVAADSWENRAHELHQYLLGVDARSGPTTGGGVGEVA